MKRSLSLFGAIMGFTYRPLSKPLHRQIEHFISWKKTRHPLKARQCELDLYAFFRSVRVNSATQLEEGDIALYLSGLNAEYERRRVKSSIKQFLNYWYRVGLLEREFTGVVNKSRMDGNMHTEQVERVQKLREEGLAFRQIKLHMEAEDGKRYDIHQIHRWSKYVIPSTSSKALTG